MTLQQRLLAMLQAKPEMDQEGLNAMLRLLAKWRHGLIANTLRRREGEHVLGGPFAGMLYPIRSAEGCEVPRLLGCYEQEIAPVLERLIGRGFGQVLNIGCAEGYYAVGMARRLPAAQIHAYDQTPAAREACRALAEANGVAARVTIGGLFEGRHFADFPAAQTLVLLDIEGGEDALLDPRAHPGLLGLTVLVECHDGFLPGLSQRIAARFAESHIVTRIDHALGPVTLPAWLNELGHLDRLLATWEWRAGPTPWLVLEPR